MKTTTTMQPHKVVKTLLPIKRLEKYQVYVFESSPEGFHSEGEAGWSMHGCLRTPKGDPSFERAKAAPVGHHDTKGKWAVWGVSRGHQIGREGESYSLSLSRDFSTKEEKSLVLRDLYSQIKDLILFARKNPDKEFLISEIRGIPEVDLVWETAKERIGFPSNFTFIKVASSSNLGE